MKEVTRNALVGAFVLASLAMLAILMVWFGETPSWLGGSTWTLRITGTKHISGIGDGSPVRLNGIEIGRVSTLEFRDPTRPGQGVEILAKVDNQYSVPQGAVAKIYGATLGLGTGHVEIDVEARTGAGMLPKEDAQIYGEMRNAIGELFNKDLFDEVTRTVNHIGNLTAEWTPVGTNLAELLEQRSIADVNRPGAAEHGVVPNFSTAIQRIDLFIAHLNKVLGDSKVQDDVKSAVGDVKVATEELRETILLWKSQSQEISDNVNHGIDKTEINLDQAFTQLNKVLEHLDDASKSIARALERVAAGEGTAGLLVRDDRLYEAAVLSLERFADAIGSLQRIFGKIERDGYITIGQAPSGLLRKKLPIGAQASDMPSD